MLLYAHGQVKGRAGGQSRAVRAAEAAGNILENMPLDYNMCRLEKMQGVDAEQVRGVARKYLNLENAYQFAVAP